MVVVALPRGSSCAPSLRRMLSACERVRRGGVYTPVLAPSLSLTRREGAIKHYEDSLFECCCLLLQDLCHGKARRAGCAAACGSVRPVDTQAIGYVGPRTFICFTTSEK